MVVMIVFHVSDVRESLRRVFRPLAFPQTRRRVSRSLLPLSLLLLPLLSSPSRHSNKQTIKVTGHTLHHHGSQNDLHRLHSHGRSLSSLLPPRRDVRPSSLSLPLSSPPGRTNTLLFSLHKKNSQLYTVGAEGYVRIFPTTNAVEKNKEGAGGADAAAGGPVKNEMIEYHQDAVTSVSLHVRFPSSPLSSPLLLQTPLQGSPHSTSRNASLTPPGRVPLPSSGRPNLYRLRNGRSNPSSKTYSRISNTLNKM